MPENHKQQKGGQGAREDPGCHQSSVTPSWRAVLNVLPPQSNEVEIPNSTQEQMGEKSQRRELKARCHSSHGSSTSSELT